jgi:hypothetical protein
MAHETHPHGTALQDPFGPAEWQRLQAEDRSAARAIVYLLVGIFGTGVILYSIVALTF